jgi:hypothetical protein
MAAPHVAGAVAVVQSKAQATLGRRLTPAEVRQVLVDSAVPMGGRDGLYDWPCGSPLFVDCGEQLDGMTGQPYQRWQVGAGYLNVAAALERVASLPAATNPQPAPTTQPALAAPPAGTTTTPVRATLPPARPGGRSVAEQRAVKRRRAAYKRCVKRANRAKRATRKQTARARARGRARCKARYA